MADQNVEVARLQKEIREYLGLDDEHLMFEYNEESGRVKLDLITINPRHNQSFLFHTVRSASRTEALREMLNYIQHQRERENSYTIQWSVRGKNILHTSYFRARNVYEALDKLNYGRDMSTINVYSVVLNPIS